MKRSLYTRFILGYLFFGLICFGIVSIFTARLTTRAALRNAASRIYSQAIRIADNYSSLYISGQIPSDFRNRLRGVEDYADMRIWFIDTDGMIHFDSSEKNSLEGVPIEHFDPAASQSYYQTGHYYGFFSQDMLSVQAPITANFQTYGYVIAHTPLEDVLSYSDSMLQPSYLTALIVFLFSFLLYIEIYVLVMRPLDRITKGAGEYASGNLQHKIPVTRNDEMGYLAETLNLMASELANSEDYQKKFIANVSHDFRSPLTSIKGYLTAILDGIIPRENEEKYLRIVIHETERLENLTQSMLSLNSLNRKNLHLEYSDFDICPLIKNVCETFERKCQMRQISFDLILEEASIRVYADMGKIQQVLYNLIDNAIKFSYDNSSITIGVSQRRNKVFVSIRDTGIGISREDQKQIFSRFFKGDSSRGKDKKGTGLGLAIVKEIITAHEETIDVISTEGAGTEFIFSLSPAKSDL